jgi:hypothetical protein
VKDDVTEESGDSADTTLDADAKALNQIDTTKLWIRMMTLGQRPGRRVVKPELVQKYLGLETSESEAIHRVFTYCISALASMESSPAALVGDLIKAGLDIQRATLIVDAADRPSSEYRELQARQEMLNISERLDELENALHEGVE